MKKIKESQKVNFDKTELAKSIIYKLEDDDDKSEAPMYFTLQALRFYVVETIWDKWDELMSEDDKQSFTKSELCDNDEFLFAYLEDWNYVVTRIGLMTTK
jgi:hypothetical protein